MINDNTVQVRQDRILIAATGYGDLRAAWHCPTWLFRANCYFAKNACEWQSFCILYHVWLVIVSWQLVADGCNFLELVSQW